MKELSRQQISSGLGDSRKRCDLPECGSLGDEVGTRGVSVCGICRKTLVGRRVGCRQYGF